MCVPGLTRYQELDLLDCLTKQDAMTSVTKVPMFLSEDEIQDSRGYSKHRQCTTVVLCGEQFGPLCAFLKRHHPASRFADTSSPHGVMPHRQEKGVWTAQRKKGASYHLQGPPTTATIVIMWLTDRRL